MIPETLVEDQESRFRITREHGIHELMNEIDLWVGKIHIVAPTAGFWPGHDTSPSMYSWEYVIVPELGTQGAKQDTNMTKTTEGLLSELNKADEQNTTHEANIFEDKDDENEKNTSCNNQQSDVHMLQRIECVDGTKQEVD